MVGGNPTSDEPVQIWAEPCFQGKPTGPIRRVPTARQRRSAGLVFPHPAPKYEVRIGAGGGSPNGTRVVATYPVSVTGDDAPARTTSPPAWVTTLRPVDKAAQEAAYRKAMDQPTLSWRHLVSPVSCC